MATVTVRSGANYQQEIVAGDHYFFADEPQDVGGDDTAPNPYELLLGALGACTSITIQMYAQRKGWPLEKVEVELSHHRDYAKDCEDCETEDTRIDVVEIHLAFEGALDEEQQTRLHAIAKRCPVSQTLGAGIRIIHR